MTEPTPAPIAAPLIFAALARLMPLVDKRWTIAIYKHALLQATGDRLALTVSNGDIEATCDIDAPGVGVWSTCADAASLQGLLKGCKGDVTLTPPGEADECLGVRMGPSCNRLAVLPADDFPRFSAFGPNPAGFVTHAPMLAEHCKAVAPFISREQTRYYLCGAYFHPHAEGVRMVATDGHKFSLRTLDGETRDGPLTPLIIPRRAVEWIARQTKTEGDAVVTTEGKRFAVAFEGARIVGKAIDANFPDYSRLCGQDDGPGVVVSLAEFRGALDLVLCATEASKAKAVVMVEARDDGLRLACGHAAGLSGETFIDASPDEGAAIVFACAGGETLKALGFVFRDDEPVRITVGTFVTIRSVATPEREAVFAPVVGAKPESYDFEQRPLERPAVAFTMPSRNMVFGHYSHGASYSVTVRRFTRSEPERREYRFPSWAAAARAWLRHKADAERRCAVTLDHPSWEKWGPDMIDPAWPVVWLTEEQVAELKRRDAAITNAALVFEAVEPDEAPWPRKAFELKDFHRYGVTPRRTLGCYSSTKAMEETARRYLTKAAAPPEPVERPNLRVPARWSGASAIALSAAA